MEHNGKIRGITPIYRHEHLRRLFEKRNVRRYKLRGTNTVKLPNINSMERSPSSMRNPSFRTNEQLMDHSRILCYLVICISLIYCLYSTAVKMKKLKKNLSKGK